MIDNVTKPADVPVKFEVSAKAQANFELKAEIPKESTGRLVDALTDIIRPFAETRGLKADILRLQREEVLIEIAKKARQRALEENLQLHSVPNKFLVPFLEKASIEEIDSQLTDQWANLLLSASESVRKHC